MSNPFRRARQTALAINISSNPMTGGIKRKAGFTITVTAGVIILMSLSVMYAAGFFIIKDTSGSERFEIAKALSLTAAENIAGEVEDINTYTTRPLWIKVCEEANQKYAGMDEAAIKKYMLECDLRWMKAAPEDEFIRRYTSGEVADSMRQIISIRGTVSEVFITDRFGGIVYSAEKTTDFYQADEEWWQKAFTMDKGSAYLGQIEYDASSNKWGATMAAPIIKDGSGIIGVCKIFIQIEKLFGFVNEFTLGRTGQAILIDSEGHTLVRPEQAPYECDFMGLEELSRFRKSSVGYIMTAVDGKNKKKLFIAMSKINSYTLEKNGLEWSIILSQDLGEAMEHLNTFIAVMAALTLLMLPLTIPAGLFFGAKITRPIEELGNIAGKIAAGDLDPRINIHTGDEIEQFAETFKNMIFAIKTSRNNLIKAKSELERFVSNQESTIEERTRDLRRSQEATLNILEDLVEAKDKLEHYAKELEGALKIKTDFTATVSHELRTPLAAIKEGIAIVADGTAGTTTERQREFLEIAKRNVDRLTRLINDLLDFQKLEAGKIEFNIKDNDINAVASDVGATMSPLASSKGLLLKLDLEEGLPTIRFDKDKITQALSNIVSNALRYTDKGSVTISTERSGNLVKVSVADTGIGIKPQDMPKLFKRFSQLEPISDRRVGGTGLGLAISKEIIDAHKGKLQVSSKPGEGSIFSFILPVTERRGEYAHGEDTGSR